MKHKGQGTVEVIAEGIIRCRLSGRVDKETVAATMAETRRIVQARHQKQQAVCLMLDISAVTSTSSAARSMAKQMGSFGFERIAVVGGKRFIVMVGQYIVSSGGMSAYTRFMRTEANARRWLLGTSNNPSQTIRWEVHSWLTAYVGFLGILVPLVVLIGWAINNETLKRIYPGLTSMNPVTALCFIMLSVSLLIVNLQYSSRRHKWVAVLLQYIVGLIGLAVLLRFFTHANLPVDRWLFHSKLDTPGYPPSKIAPNAALNFLLISSCLLLSRGSQLRRKVAVQQALLLVALASVVTALIGYAYGFNKLYQFGSFIPMALHTATLFLLIIVAIFAMHRRWFITRNLLRLNRIVWIGLVVVALALVLTGVAWRQNQEKIQQQKTTQFNEDLKGISDRISQRLSTYQDALNGFRAFFAASTQVSQGDFHNYYSSLNLMQNYPGVRSVAFIKQVSAAQKQQFINQVRSDTTLPSSAHPNFTITPSGNRSAYYVVTYAEPTSQNFGYDVGTNATRLSNLLKSQQTGDASASTTVNFNDTIPGAAPAYGFFITLPIYQKPDGTVTNVKTGTVFGYINATFLYPKLFNNLLTDYVQKGLMVSLSDKASGSTFYEQANANAKRDGIHESVMTIAAGRPWILHVSAPQNYGVVGDAEAASRAILLGGITAAGLLLVLFMSLARSRDQAVQLALGMTDDLHAERDAAVAMQEKDDAILSSIGDAVFAIDVNNKLTLFNPAAEQISGYSAEEAISSSYQDILHFAYQKTGEPNDSFIRQAFLGHITSMKNHTVLIHKDGHRIAVADSAAPIRSADKKIIGVIVVFRDVSKEQQLDQAKTEFVSLASHQLRTPLSAINWYSEMLLSGDAGTLQADQSEYVTQIQEGNQRMIELVNSLLDVSRLDLGKFVNLPVAVSLKELVQSVSLELKGAITQKNLHYNTDIAHDVPDVLVDPKLLRMIVQNFLSNAVKYTTDKGTIQLSVSLADAAVVRSHKLHAGSYIEIRVHDNGLGIPASQQAKVFSKLFRADNVQTLDVEGTGLGLYIVKEVVTKLGGAVWFESTEKAGSTFHALIPVVTKATKGV